METTSHLTRGAWIEINTDPEKFFYLLLSHLTRGAWIEICLNVRRCQER